MATGGNAIFTEVLQIGIDTSVFAAQMKQVEQIYANSIKNMPNLAQVGNIAANQQVQQFGNQFTKLATEIRDATQSIESNVIHMSQQVGQGLQQMANNASSAANTTRKAFDDLSFGEKFANALERAFIRVPAMALASTALLAVMTALGAPIKAIVDGFENLGNQTPAFKQVRTQLADTLSVIESIAAKPLFDVILVQLQSLAKWLTDNKSYVEQLALAFGHMIATFATILIDFAKMDIVKDTFKGIAEFVSIAVFGVQQLVIELKTMLGLVTTIGTEQGKDNGDGTVGGWFKAIGHNIKNVFTNDKVGGVLDQHEAESQDNANALTQALDAINGKGTAPVPEVTAASQLKTSQEIMADFRVDLADIKEKAKAATDEIAEKVTNLTLSKTAALPKVLAADAEEKKSIDELIAKYREKLKAATDLPTLDSSKMRQIEDRLLLGGRSGSPNSPYSQSEARDKAAREAANKERIEDEKITSAALLKINEEYSKEEIALIKKAVSEGHLTREQGVQADIAVEQQRHYAALLDITSRPAAPGSKEEAQRSAALAEENAKHDIANKEAQQALTDARIQDARVLEQHREAMAKDNIALVEATRAEELALGSKKKHIDATKEIIQLKLQEAAAELKVAQANLARDGAGTPAGNKDQETILRLQTQIRQLQNQADASKYGSTALGKVIQGEDIGHSQDVGDMLKESLHLDDAARDWDNANNGLQKFTSVLEGTVGVLQGLASAVTGAVSAYQKGGAVGAAGSLLSNKSFDEGLGSLIGKVSESVGKMVPVIGPLIGGMFSAISSLFSAGIQQMVQNINDKIAAINEQAKIGQITLSQQITELQQEKQDAINQLGGSKKKGASSELKKILTSLNDEIAQLQKQQHDIITNFNQIVAAASLGTPVFQQWYQTWDQINRQVKQYIDAGGSLTTAAQFLTQQLQQQRQSLQDQLNQADQTAIGDAIQLNNLLLQRVQMMKQEAETEFGLINGDSAERRTSNAVKLGTELTKQRAQYAQQLTDLNNQISLEQQKVDAESKIFDINKSIADLQKASNALTIASLDEQLAKYQDMAKILASTASLQFAASSLNPYTGATATLPIPGEPNVNGSYPTVGQPKGGPVRPVNITINHTGPISEAGAASLGQEIDRNIRSGRTTFSTTSNY
jgi:hypothetical protein